MARNLIAAIKVGVDEDDPTSAKHAMDRVLAVLAELSGELSDKTKQTLKAETQRYLLLV